MPHLTTYCAILFCLKSPTLSHYHNLITCIPLIVVPSVILSLWSIWSSNCFFVGTLHIYVPHQKSTRFVPLSGFSSHLSCFSSYNLIPFRFTSPHLVPPHLGLFSLFSTLALLCCASFSFVFFPNSLHLMSPHYSNTFLAHFEEVQNIYYIIRVMWKVNIRLQQLLDYE